MQPELPLSGGVSVDCDLGLQGDENQAAQREGSGFESRTDTREDALFHNDEGMGHREALVAE